MSSLTSSQINQSYQGLLKLADSTTGITSSLQSVQDGLGNDTGIKISGDRFITKNAVSLPYIIPDAMGEGYNITTQQFPAGSQNIVIAAPIYDAGLYSYSAMTYSIQTLSAVDTVTMGFYTSQWVDGVGLAPKDVIISGITLDVASTGVKTTTLPSTLSFSGTGADIYWMVWKISNSNVQPVVRFAGVPSVSNAVTFGAAQYGTVPSATNAAYSIMPWKGGLSTVADTIFYPSIANLPLSFSPADVAGFSTLLTAIRRPGYTFKVIK